MTFKLYQGRPDDGRSYVVVARSVIEAIEQVEKVSGAKVWTDPPKYIPAFERRRDEDRAVAHMNGMRA